MNTEKRTILIAKFLLWISPTTHTTNLGGMQLKSFPVDFRWISNETQSMYEWFLDAMTVTYGEDINAVFVTDKCQALMDALDKKFPAIKDEYVNSVYKAMYSTTEAGYNDGLMTFQAATDNINNYVDVTRA
ncbi:hypothetical protein CU097_007102 [Rhizopus azygosporus]|uniref:MULE transposase domain-containing protein n=1 Tax=Rhizopus azygosporus TaxID=86630 RepID=A0A367IY94_RHIAZ|nr:hypothetical protein CU097_007102 [Rhizopus azygosporus]